MYGTHLVLHFNFKIIRTSTKLVARTPTQDRSGNLLIDEIIWQQQFVEKLATKHSVEKTEVEEVLTNRPRFRFVSKGNRSGEDVYSAMRQTDAGRYLIVFSSTNQIVGR